MLYHCSIRLRECAVAGVQEPVATVHPALDVRLSPVVRTTIDFCRHCTIVRFSRRARQGRVPQPYVTDFYAITHRSTAKAKGWY